MVINKLQFIGYAGDAVSAFSRESLAKSFAEDRRKSSRFTIEKGEIYLLRPTAIVLRVHLIFFIKKSLRYTCNTIEDVLRLKSSQF